MVERNVKIVQLYKKYKTNIATNVVLKMKGGNILAKAKKEYNLYKCLSCESQPTFDHSNMMKHLTEKHGINTKNKKGKREPIMHMDGIDFYIWHYKWTVDGVAFLQKTCNKRRRSMRQLSSWE